MPNLTRTLVFASAIAASTLPVLAESRDFNLDAFDKIAASAGIEIDVIPGERQNVRVEAKSDSDFKHLQMDVHNGTLRVSTDYNLFDFIIDGGLVGSIFNDGPGLKVFITLPAFEQASVSSGASAEIHAFASENFSASASSGADIILDEVGYENLILSASSGADIKASGTCTTIEGNVSSGADINATDLECTSARANASSGGDIVVFASDAISANASSGGDIRVKGNPEARELNTSSGGDITIQR